MDRRSSRRVLQAQDLPRGSAAPMIAPVRPHNGRPSPCRHGGRCDPRRAGRGRQGGAQMLLAVDVGNTQTVLGLFDATELVAHWRIHSDASTTADELRLKVSGMLGLAGRTWDDVAGIALASVVPRLTFAWEEVAEQAGGLAMMVVGPGLRTGMPIRYDNPHEVGADRIVNGVAAYASRGGPVVVIDFGTATTLDVVDADGAYLGGVIAPGVETSAEALFTKAARLSKVDLEAPVKVIGTNTRM
ncbi:MAG: type III pantothenate kinase, partial [Actinobacteria bacterium]